VKASELKVNVVVAITREDSYTAWWCRDCRYGDSYLSGVGRVLESVDQHVNERHRADMVFLTIPQKLMTSRVWYFESIGKCTCPQGFVGSRSVCVHCNGVVSTA
jgi:hypothetical protein